MNHYEPALQAALKLTEAPAQIAAKAFLNPPEVDLKEDESPVTRADRETELAVREALTTYFPDDGIFGEEFGTEGLERDRIWVVDPIDGTKSFITGVPLFGLLLALVAEGVPQIGIIRLPGLNTVYSGLRGKGASKDGAPIQTSSCEDLSNATIFINEAEKIHAADAPLFARLCKIGKLRRMGYDCHPHALVAEGRVDAVVDFDLKPYDYLPVAAVVEAAGGVMTDWQGRSLDFNSDGRVLSAATPALHSAMLEALNR